HQGKVAAAAVMLALLVAGVAASTWQAVRATRAERKANEALVGEMAAKAQTREALDALTDDGVGTMFARQPVVGEDDKAFLRKVLGYYEAFTRELGEAAEARFLRAKGSFKVASLRATLGERHEAVTGYRQAVALLEALAAEFPDVPSYRERLAA